MSLLPQEIFPHESLMLPGSPEAQFVKEIRSFREFGRETAESRLLPIAQAPVPLFTNEFWTSQQRAGHNLHEISYRACFKPQVPRFFIERLTQPGDLVYDPFMGRGTTLVEGALLGRSVAGCDISPLGTIFTGPRLHPPSLEAVSERLEAIDWSAAREEDTPASLLAFYHPDTLQKLGALRHHLLRQEKLDPVDAWLQMVATNRLTGHSPGFFSVYSLPPNQAVSVERQLKINEKRNQTPPPRDVAAIILKKSKQLLKTLTSAEAKRLEAVGATARVLTRSCDETPEIRNDSVRLVVTSPPFLGVVDYKQDNWLRCWFNGIDAKAVPIWQLNNISRWNASMLGVFKELRRILTPGGWIAFEVGEVMQGMLKMEELVVPIAEQAGLKTIFVMINAQNFTKTANCWGVNNNECGTNTNRIVLLQKPGDRGSMRRSRRS